MRMTVYALGVVTVMGVFGGVSNGEWYPDKDWDFRQTITIQSSKVHGPLTNFPVLITHTNAQPGLWANAQGNGDDILFTASDGVTKLSHEIEIYDTNTQRLAAWVRVPELSGSVDTEIHMYYGNESAANQETATNVWDSGYRTVHHLHETSGTHADSTLNDVDAIPMPYGSTETGTVTISTCESTNGWLELDGTISLSAAQKTEGSYSVQFVIPSIDDTRVYTNVFDPDAVMDLGSREVVYRWRYDGVDVWGDFDSHKVYVFDTNGNFRVRNRFPYYGNDDIWHSHYPDDYSGVASNGPVDMHHIDRIEWHYDFKNTVAGNSCTIWIDDIRAGGILDQGAVGVADGADLFDADKACVLMEDNVSYSNVTMSAWFKLDSDSYGGAIIGDAYYQNPYPSRFGITIGRNNNFALVDDNYVRLFLWRTTSVIVGPEVDTNWHLVVGTRDAVRSILYIDGVEVGTSNYVAAAYSEQLSFGALFGGLDKDIMAPFGGILDEVRVSSVARSSNWVATCFNNQGAPQTFADTSAEQPYPVLGTMISIR